MRILHIHSGNLYGGVETMLGAMARAHTPGHQPVFAFTTDGAIAEQVRQAGCEVHILGSVRAREPGSVVRVRKALSILCTRSAFDASIVHSAWALTLLGPAAPRPLVLYQHDTLDRFGWAAQWSRCAHPNLVIANSQYTARTIAGHYKHAPLRVIHPCVELATSASASARTNTQTVILQAARFEPWKGHALLLRALATLRDNLNWTHWIAGGAQRSKEAALQAELEALACKLGIADRVSFLGHCSDMPSLMRSADIYCQPDTAPEPFGLTFVEALDAGLSIVATALGGDREILAPDFGIMAAPTVESVAGALRQLIDNPQFRATLAQSGPARARQLCHPRSQVEKLESAIGSITAYRNAA